MKLIINQNNDANYEEPVTSLVIDKLYNLSKNNALTQDSHLRGRIKATKAYTDAVDYLNEEFGPDLIVSADVSYIRFEDPEVERVLMANNFSSDGIGITTADAAAKEIGNIFQNNTTIRYFDELPYFKHTTGTISFSGCTNLESINLTDCTNYISFGSGSCNPTYFMGKDRDPYYLECGFNPMGIVCSNLKHVKFLESCPNLMTNALRGASIEIIEMVPKAGWSIGGFVFYGHAIQEVYIENIDNYWTCSFGDFGVASASANTKFYVNGTQITSITVPQGSTQINSGLWDQASTITSINWNGTESSILAIKNWAFRQCGINFGDLTLSVCTEIGNNSFTSCTFGHLSLPSIVTIGNSSFNGATMTRLTISHNLTTVGTSAFYNIHNLARVDTDSLDAWLNISFGNESSNPVQFCKNLYVNDILVTAADFTGKTEVKPYVFYNYDKLTSVIMPNTITSIGKGAFYHCTGLTSVTIPGSVLSIGDAAFNGCTGLTSIIIPEGVKKIEGWTFRGCSNLASVSLPSTLEDAYWQSFFGIPWLNNFPDGDIYINNMYFYCKGTVPANVVIQQGTTKILRDVLHSSNTVTSVSIPDTVTYIAESAFDACSTLASINIPNGITVIPMRFCRACGLTSITIPSNITTISQDAFYNTRISSLVIPDSVTSIGNYAFCECPYLTDVTIGTGVTSIGSAAFRNGSDSVSNGFTLRSTLTVTIYATIPPSIAAGTSKPFAGYGLITIYVPSASLNAYKTANYWKDYKDYIQAIPNT